MECVHVWVSLEEEGRGEVWGTNVCDPRILPSLHLWSSTQPVHSVTMCTAGLTDTERDQTVAMEIVCSMESYTIPHPSPSLLNTLLSCLTLPLWDFQTPYLHPALISSVCDLKLHVVIQMKAGHSWEQKSDIKWKTSLLKERFSSEPKRPITWIIAAYILMTFWSSVSFTSKSHYSQSAPYLSVDPKGDFN